jgi:hypothetical protein
MVQPRIKGGYVFILFNIQSCATQLHLIWVNSFGPLARPLSDLYDDNSLAKNQIKTLFVYAGYKSFFNYKYVIKHRLNYDFYPT